jgi:hypothetical protein
MYLFFAGFRDSYRPTAPPNHGLEDNRPDVHEEADFDIPDTEGGERQFGRRESYSAGHPEEGERQFGASNGAVSFQLAQVRCGPDCVPVSLVIYIDGSFIKH